MADDTAHRVVVLGGGYAGLTAAARIGETAGQIDLTLIDPKPGFVERIRLHEIAAGTEPRRLPYAPFMSDRNGRFIQAKAVALDTDEKTVRLARADGASAEVSYDTLVYAVGSHTDRTSVSGVEDFAARLDTVPDSEALAAQLAALADSRGALLVAGGGLTAIEAVCEFAERLPGLNVTLAPGRNFGPGDGPGDLSRVGFGHVKQTLKRLNVDILAGARITALHRGHAEFENGKSVPFDACLWAAGFVLPPLARDAGLSVTSSGQVVTDGTLASVSHPDILAVGDCAYVVAEPAGECRMSCAAGRPMGELAAATAMGRLSGAATAPFEFRYSFRCISLGRGDGLIQFVDARDRPVEQIWTGERGARWKEYICRRTLAGVGFTSDLGPPPDTPPEIA